MLVIVAFAITILAIVVVIEVVVVVAAAVLVVVDETILTEIAESIRSPLRMHA